MLINFRDTILKIILLLLLGPLSWAKTLPNHHRLDTSFGTEDLNKYELETQGDSYLMSCDWEEGNNPTNDIEHILMGVLNKSNSRSKADGICKNLNKEDLLKDPVFGLVLNQMKPFYEYVIDNKRKVGGGVDQNYTYTVNPFVEFDFVGKDKVGSSFDLGAFAKCEINQEEIASMIISKFCAGKGGLPFSPAATLTANTVDAMGLPSYGGKDGDKNNTIKKVADRHYPSKDKNITGKILYEDNGTGINGNPDGGILLAEAKEDPYGSTATALNSFDKATLVLKDLALKNFGTSDVNVTTLPATKAQSMDLEDEIVQMQTRMDADLNQFNDTLTRTLRKEILDKTLITRSKNDDTLVSQPYYAMREKKTTSDFFKSKVSALSAIYKGIEDEAKARMASEMLLMTTDPNYIADPSEARAALIKPAQRNKFRYAALIQQEKNKMLKLKYAKEIKRKQQRIDLIKKQAYIRASVFRPVIANNELDELLKAADATVEVNGTTQGKNIKNPGPPCKINGKPGHKDENDVCIPD